ncbi:MAG TPA: response regulator [Ignavibacteriales bacterium]|nr:response regulator [Ignavibacteriales bacterium]HOL81448.1 response regulator [Ignavibacteriales bacterium]HOM65346.1 response regulator [Ignavibacteriales bacterium]HPD66974.1 response regulator [Ignavibacteriales bacterium]HPP33625.1 response regulator [Ignavibacteriales bacterium]
MLVTFEPNQKILYIDDENSLLLAFKSIFRKSDYEIHLLQDPTQAEKYIKENGPFAVILSDQRMPDMYGYEVLKMVKEISPDTQRILITGFSDLNDTVESINQAQISKYISKPWDEINLKEVVAESIRIYNLETHNKLLYNELVKKNKELDSAYSELRLKSKKLDEIYNETIVKIVQIFNSYLTSANPQLKEHSSRVISLGSLIVNKLDIAANHKWATNIALHLCTCAVNYSHKADNKINEIYKDNNFLKSQFEFAEYISTIPSFEIVGDILKYQHKNFDGSGFPEKLKAYPSSLPLGSQIIKIIINFDLEFPGLYIDEKKLTDYKHFIKGNSNYDTNKMPYLLKIHQFVEFLNKIKNKTNIYNPKIVNNIISLFNAD